MTLNTLLTQLATAPEQIRFADVLATIAANYTYTPQTFTNGSGDDTVTNPAGTNEGSCKLFAFAHLQGLSATQTLACFGEHYRDVLATPTDTNHANIRTFMRHGWAGIHFNGNALQANP
ncbi:HopJ type III effector protein [Thiothrix fructosivorans]|uniref:HopJ type III effector protein n=1 Tax=Thiothrix fructosivorans TaxID=111770 RepID=A0A8B0SKY7_9GAMM|nr:HopJ type III effector protein [Thiothrix fructosivorans]MBO0611618.1 HopJ type III effector protein [Thiothrix fructosivorans]QTX10718.1 HopJ type III effector protein [Thiothrix fructosivorans]